MAFGSKLGQLRNDVDRLIPHHDFVWTARGDMSARGDCHCGAYVVCTLPHDVSGQFVRDCTSGAKRASR